MRPLAARVRDAAKLFGVSHNLLYEWVRLGRLKSYPVGRGNIVFLADIEQQIRAQPTRRKRGASRHADV